MTEIKTAIKAYEDGISRFKINLTRWNQIKGMLKAFKEEGVPAPKRYKENAEDVLVQVVSFRMFIKLQRKKYDINFLQKKLDKYVSMEEYEKAIPYRDRLNVLKAE